MNKDEIAKYQAALINELTTSILKKVAEIKEKVDLGTGSTRSDYLQILTMVDDDLDDVLLNWETQAYTSRLYMSEDDLIDDSLDDE